MPGLVCGITAVAEGDGAGSDSDYGLATGGSASSVVGKYEALARGLGLSAAAVARQVHGARVVSLPAPIAPQLGVHVVGEADGIASDGEGVLLAVTVADCVPVFLADSAGRALAVVHAGWRGITAGVVERGISVLRDDYGATVSHLRVHLGTAICGSCYEVGAEVMDAFGHTARSGGKLDLRLEIAARVESLGIPRDRISRSGDCTMCGPNRAHSHRARGSSAGRMAAFLGRIEGS